MTVLPCSNDSDIEDILAAIRRQTASEPGACAVTAERRQADACSTSECDDPADELPAMLRRVEARPSASVHPFKRPTGERLSEVLRRATERVMRPAVASRAEVDPPAAATAVTAGEPKRDMSSVQDTRMRRMGATAVALAEAARGWGCAGEVATWQDCQPIALTPARTETSLAMTSGRLESLDLSAVATADAAEILRPLLKEWLAANMPRILERALYLEMTGSSPVGRDVVEG